MSKQKLFISHAVKDRVLADAVVDLIESGTTLTTSQIVTSSLGERGAADGEEFTTYIDSTIQNPAAAILLLSPNYFSSRFCLCEMGATLARTRNVLPLLIPPLDYKHMKGLFALTPVDRIDSTDDLNRFVATLQTYMAAVELNLPQWAMKKKQFLASLPSILEQISAK